MDQQDEAKSQSMTITPRVLSQFSCHSNGASIVDRCCSLAQVEVMSCKINWFVAKITCNQLHYMGTQFINHQNNSANSHWNWIVSATLFSWSIDFSNTQPIDRSTKISQSISVEDSANQLTPQINKQSI